MKVFVTARFEAAHWLPLVPEDHKCRRMHGHSYCVRLEVEGDIGDDGMVVDFAVVKAAWKRLHEVLDHHVLNDVVDNPTAENLSRWIHRELIRSFGADALKVTLWETQDCGAIYP